MSYLKKLCFNNEDKTKTFLDRQNLRIFNEFILTNLKIFRINYRTSLNIRIIKVFLESLLSVSFPSLGVTVHLPSLGCPPAMDWSLDLL